MRKLLVRCNGKAMFQDPATVFQKNKRYFGWSYDPSIGKGGAYVEKEEPELILEQNYLKGDLRGTFKEMMDAVKVGDLLAADEETSKLCK